MIVDRDTDPNETILYISACISRILKVTSFQTEDLYNKLLSEFGLHITYNSFLLALNFLFLLGKVQVGKSGEVYVLK